MLVICSEAGLGLEMGLARRSPSGTGRFGWLAGLSGAGAAAAAASQIRPGSTNL
jgi:hypothetical protein